MKRNPILLVIFEKIFKAKFLLVTLSLIFLIPFHVKIKEYSRNAQVIKHYEKKVTFEVVGSNPFKFMIINKFN